MSKLKARCFREADARSITMGTAKLKKKDANEKIQPFLRHYGPALLGLLMLVPRRARYLRTHGYLAIAPPTQQEIKKVNAGLDQLNKGEFAARAGSARAQDRPP